VGSEEETMPTREPGRPPEQERKAPPPDPYYEGYFGTEEEAGVVREQDDAEVEDPEAEEADEADPPSPS
jgi:hypothetical protein